VTGLSIGAVDLSGALGAAAGFSFLAGIVGSDLSFFAVGAGNDSGFKQPVISKEAMINPMEKVERKADMGEIPLANLEMRRLPSLGNRFKAGLLA